MSKNVQIPLSLFLDLYDFVCDPVEYNFLKDDLHNTMNSKFDALIRRSLFTQYKTASIGSCEREEFRKKYLEEALISRSFKTDTEVCDF